MNRLGFVTNSPLFDNPAGFNPGATSHEEDIRMRAAAQRAMEAGRPMTMAEMYGKNLQLFRTLNGFEGGILGKLSGCRVTTLLAGATLTVFLLNVLESSQRPLPWNSSMVEKLTHYIKDKRFLMSVGAGAVVMAGSRKLFCKP